MDYDKMKALTEASREKSAGQRDPESKEFPKPDSGPDWKYLGHVARERMAPLGEAAVMITPTIFQWYRISRQHYRFTVFQAVRGALWLAS